MKPTGYYHTDVPVTRALRERVERDEANAYDVLDACEEQERQAADLRARPGGFPSCHVCGEPTHANNIFATTEDKHANYYHAQCWAEFVIQVRGLGLNGETPPPAGQPWAPAPAVDPIAALDVHGGGPH